MSASTQGVLFYGAVSDDFDTWKHLQERHGRKAVKQGLRFGSLADGETTGFYLAVAKSLVSVNAGASKPLTAQQCIPPWEWKETIETFAKEIHLSLRSSEPTWYIACETDRDW
jgi:hypothetical protein